MRELPVLFLAVLLLLLSSFCGIALRVPDLFFSGLVAATLLATFGLMFASWARVLFRTLSGQFWFSFFAVMGVITGTLVLTYAAGLSSDVRNYPGIFFGTFVNGLLTAIALALAASGLSLLRRAKK